jgi:hypothetical protein
MILDLLFLKHKMWLNYIKSFDCSDAIAEDYVQEMYIKIYLYVEKNGNELMYNKDEVNFYFIYVTLKNMYYDDLRRAKRIKLEPISHDIIQDESEYSEFDFYLKNDAIEAWHDNLINEINEIDGYTRTKANLYYVKFIFDMVFVKRVSVSELSRRVGITYWSLRHTVLLIKKQIKEKI